MFKDVVIKFMRVNFPGHPYAYDGGSSIYTNGLLMDNDSFTGQVVVPDPERGENKEFFVTIGLADNGVIDLTGLPQKLLAGTVEIKIIQAFDIIFKWHSARRPVIQTRKGFYPSAEIPIDIGGGKQIRRGFTHTVIPGAGLCLNVDVIYKIFPKSGSFVQGIINDVCVPQGRYAQPINLSRGLNDYQRGDLEEFVKGLKVEFRMPDRPGLTRKYRVDGLAECPAKNMFDFNGRKISVERYFKEEKGYKIEYPYLPCLLVKAGGKKLSYPIELGEILPNQVKRFRSNDFDTKKIGEQATCRTDERQDKIKKEVRDIDFRADRYLESFGIEVSDEFKKVDGRVLFSPTIQYKNQEVPVRQGKWNAGKFLSGKKLTKWGFLVFEGTRPSDRNRIFNTVLDFQDRVQEIGRNLGMEIARPSDEPYFEKQNISEEKLEELLSSYFKDEYQILFVVLPRKDELYSKVKKVAETKVGLLTQCLLEKTLCLNARLLDSAILNILVKDNTKMNHLNHSLKPMPELVKQKRWCFYDHTMVLGADVTHPAPQDKTKIPSIAAVVANVDEYASVYKKEWDFQDPEPSDHEIIQNLEGMIAELLKSYRANVGCYPKRLVFFRDGVSDGQISEVRRQEIPAVYTASKKVSGGYIPLTFLIVQKRHSTRIFPVDEEKDKYDRKNFNVPPGTVVDREIVGQDMHQFYLVSHESILGTARPTRYKMIWDETNISADEIQHMTFYLCHMFNRCTRAVSYPAPTYYAHLACFRIRNYLATENVDMSNLKREKARLEAKLSLSTENPSYFI